MRYLHCLFFVFFCYNAFAEIFPAENSTLNYNTVYVEEALVKNARRYELIVFKDSLYKEQKPFLLKTAQVPAFWISGLPWGTEYFWRTRSFDSTGKMTNGAMHRFTIRPIVYQNLEEVRLNVRLNDSINNAGGLISVDYTRCVFDRNGKPVWTIPTEDTLMDARVQVRDFRITHNNTFTFLTGRAPLEIDRNGKILWQAPYPLMLNGDTVIYHHDFQKTKRGTYLVLGLKKVYRKIIGTYDPEILKTADVKSIKGQLYQRTQLALLLEFNQQGKIIWTWDSNTYLTDADLNHKKTISGIPNFATHANAFGENADGSKLYVGFRDLSRLIRIDKRSGKVDASYGEPYPSGDGRLAQYDFRKQHGATITNHNSIILLNNNSGIKDGGVSTVVELKDNVTPGDSIVLWRFALDFDTLTKGRSVSGGNVTEMPNKNLLVCAGTLNRVFEVSKNKKIVWDAFVEARRKGEQWLAAPQYRANWIALIGEDHFLLDVKAPENGQSQSLQIYNTGNQADNYYYEVFSEKGKLLLKGETTAVNNGQFYQLTLGEKINASKKVKIVVQSVNSKIRNEIVVEKK